MQQTAKTEFSDAGVLRVEVGDAHIQRLFTSCDSSHSNAGDVTLLKTFAFTSWCCQIVKEVKITMANILELGNDLLHDSGHNVIRGFDQSNGEQPCTAAEDIVTEPDESPKPVVVKKTVWGPSMVKLFTAPRKILRRMARITWKFATNSLMCGMVVHVSILQSKTLLCHLCKNYLTKIRPAQFWILLGFLTILFAMLNTQLLRCVKRKLFNAKQKMKRSRHEDLGYSIAKTTRSGCIYGWM